MNWLSFSFTYRWRCLFSISLTALPQEVVLVSVSTIRHSSAYHSTDIIREYGSTLYVGMARKKNGRPYISIANGKLKSLVIYTNKLKYT